ncbi:MAG: hypothetical protein RLZZ524_1748 [Pseudomonadota bacterium]
MRSRLLPSWLSFLLRRLRDAALVLLGVHLLTFALFFGVNTPDDMARLALGGKRVTAEQVLNWKRERGYDRPLLWNADEHGSGALTQTIFWQRSAALLRLDFGRSDSESGGDIGREVGRRMAVSVQLALPLFVLQGLASLLVALALVAVRGSALERWGGALTLLMLSISSLFYIVAGQALFSHLLRLAPVSGWADGWASWRFLVLPLGLALLTRLAGDVRLYRAMLLEEAGKPHVRAARARGLGEAAVLGRHVLRNAAVPVLTSAGLVLPQVFLGSLVFESYFGLPGLGAYAIEAIAAQDFAVVRTMVLLGAVLQVTAMLLVDLALRWADPRIRLDAPGVAR